MPRVNLHDAVEAGDTARMRSKMPRVEAAEPVPPTPRYLPHVPLTPGPEALVQGIDDGDDHGQPPLPGQPAEIEALNSDPEEFDEPGTKRDHPHGDDGPRPKSKRGQNPQGVKRAKPYDTGEASRNREKRHDRKAKAKDDAARLREAAEAPPREGGDGAATSSADHPHAQYTVHSEFLVQATAMRELTQNYVDTWSDTVHRTPEENDEAFHTTIEFGNEPFLYDGKDVIEVAFYISAEEITDSPTAVRETILQMVKGYPTYNASMARKRKLEIKEHQCSWEERRALACAKRSEFSSWLDNKVLDLLVAKGIDRNRAIRCRWVLTFKKLDAEEQAKAQKSLDPYDPTVRDGSNRKAKARLVILGYEDPDLGKYKTWSPTLRRDTRNVLLFICAQLGWMVFTLDAKTAFLLGKTQTREAPLFVLLPRDLSDWLGSEGPRKLNKAAYGLAEAPLAWFRTLKEHLLAVGFEQFDSDKCLFVLRGKYDSSADYHSEYQHLPILGIIGVHVDDLLCGGHGAEWDEAMMNLAKRIRFGPRKFPPVTYCGVRVKQNDTEITIDQEDYLDAIQEPSDKATDPINTCRKIAGELLWMTTQTRPDLAFDTSFLGSQILTATVETIRFARKILRRARFHRDVCLRFRRLNTGWKEACIVAFSDAGWGTRAKGHSQAGAIVAIGHPDLIEGKTAMANILDFSSSKITLSVPSSYEAELHACATTTEISENLQVTFGELSTKKGWSISKWIATGERHRTIVVIDAKGLWTKINAEHMTEKRGTIYIRRLMEILTRVGARVFWVNSGHMLADGMTKLSTKSPAPNIDILLHALSTGSLRITYCTESWRKEMAKTQKGQVKELTIQDPAAWNPPTDVLFDTEGATLANRYTKGDDMPTE